MTLREDRYEFPASFGQEQLWYLHQIAPESTAYNIASAFELRGELDEAALERAFKALIQRHDALRTGFTVVDEKLRQIVCAHVPFRLDTVDLSARARVERDIDLTELKRRCAKHRFNLLQAPLIFVQLVRLAAAHHVLLLCIHHIMVDHHSVLQLGRELEQLYRVLKQAGHQDETFVGCADVDEGRLQFPDYVVWQREQLSDEVVAHKLKYWASVLEAKPHTLNLPTDRPRPALQSFAGDELPICLSHELSGAMRDHAQRQKQSLFVLMLTALSVVLHKYSGRRDLIVGCALANRQAEELHDVVGLFMNVLPIPVGIEPSMDFTQLAEQVRRQVTRTQALQDTPFARIVRAGVVADRASHNPLVQVWFTFQDAPLALRLPGLDVVSEALHNGGSKLDLSLWFWDDGNCIRGLIEYSTDLFDRDTVIRFAQHLPQVLAQATANPGICVSDFSLLTDQDRQMHQVQCAQSTHADVLTSMHGAFFQRATVQPWRTVLTTASGEVSAGELAARADAVGAQLQRIGVLPGDIVGVCLGRNEALVACLLGVLRCGAAYLPLDPSLPAGRIAYMLEDSGVGVVIAEPETRGVLPKTGLRVVMADATKAGRDGLVAHITGTQDVAYLMYTSGSTGRPKGVRIAHGAVGNFLSSMQARPGIGQDDVLLALTTYAFDISVLELFLPMAFGARVWLADHATSADGSALKRLIDECGATVVQATPSTWRLLRASGWKGKKRLKALVGGEALSPELAQWLLPRVGELWNMYGPTETTIWSSCARIDEHNSACCPIGQPIWNTSIHIVDEGMRLLPPGVTGELVIGGRGLSLGYLNRDDLTRQRFVRLPETGEEVYRTGDRALWRDGELQHLGRNDGQIKIRGYRIELGEIESVLATLPELELVAAKAWRIDDDDHRIVAYYCSRSGAPVATTVLRDHLRGFLPNYMRPQHFVHLAAIPLLPNGKIDRNALPKPKLESNHAVAPVADTEMTPQERVVLEACRELIGSDAVQLDDNFFDAGGHSLLALTMVSRIEKKTGIRLNILKIASSSLRTLASELGTEADPRQHGDPRLGARLTRWVRTALAQGRGDVFP